MPVQKNALIRYRIINRCLSNKRKPYWSKEELIAKLDEHDVSINERTLKYDLESMRYDKRLGYLAPIEYCKINKGYYYKQQDYTIEALPLNEDEMRAFGFVTSILEQFRGLKVISDFEGALDKLRNVADQLSKGSQKSPVAIEFEKAPYYKGIEFRDRILDSIHDKKVLVIHYTTFNRPFSMKHIIHPYLLKEYKDRWYVIGLHDKTRTILTLALDRIDSITDSVKSYIENSTFKSEEYFRHLIGITISQGKPEDIVLHCKPELANYIKTQHLHSSQQTLAEDKEGLTIKLHLIPNYELISLISSYGPDIKVLKPATLQRQVAERLKKSWEQYQEQ